MNPRLIALSGPLKGQIFPLGEETLNLGRDQVNRISIADMAVSRRHCTIQKEDDSFRLIDLESRNGTFVGSVPVNERILKNGDQIRIVNSLFLFLTGDGDTLPVQSAVEVEDEQLVTYSSM